MPGVFLYYIFAGVWAGIRLAFSHPLVAGLLLVILATYQSCAYNGNWHSTDLHGVLRADEASIESYAGAPERCENIAGEITCYYSSMTTRMVGGRVREIDYSKLNGDDFLLTEAFYHHVLGMLNIEYRAPSRATINEIVWVIPGVGTITVTSNDDMRVKGVTVRA